MSSVGSEDESSCADSVLPVAEKTATMSMRRKVQVSVPEMTRRIVSRKAKRQVSDRSSRSPQDAGQPAAKRQVPSPAAAAPEGVELSTTALAAIQGLINSGIASAVAAFERKYELLERRLNVLESEAMDRDYKIGRLSQQLEDQIRINGDLRDQVESIDANRRLSSLIITCADFGKRSPNENIEEKVVAVLNRRIASLRLSIADIQVAHRLQGDNKVICKFMKRTTRDRVYDSRFDLNRRSGRSGTTDPGGDRRMAALYLSESLTPSNQRLYSRLLQARKSTGGSVRVVSVFSRRGVVYCRTVRGGPNIRVPDADALERILRGGGGGGVPDPPLQGRIQPDVLGGANWSVLAKP